MITSAVRGGFCSTNHVNSRSNFDLGLLTVKGHVGFIYLIFVGSILGRDLVERFQIAFTFDSNDTKRGRKLHEIRRPVETLE